MVRFGESLGSDLRLTGRGRDGAGWWFEVNGEARFRLGLPGRHNALNALAAVAVARRLGVPDERIDEALARCEPAEMRMRRHRIGEIVVYNDAYNANPDSVVASLATFAELAGEVRRRIVVLGDMLELGPTAPQLHEEVGRHVVDLDRRARVDHLVLIGPLWARAAAELRRVFSSKRLTVLPELTATTVAVIADLVAPGDAALIKGSRAIGLERILDVLEERQDSKESQEPLAISK